ncbi:diaminopimelate epimerase [Stenotrophomonas sp.]|uniref:diaminopimelate epimerase n=1 Tax=Stenotrophomonas sp. TaxID=69392 RepID=UPI00374D847D
MRFSKMHGAGNDFVVLDLRDGVALPDPTLCTRIANRHTGVGCDQLLTVEAPRSAGAVACYRIWNADGSPARQCGNGARCIAAWLVRDGAAPAAGDFAIESPTGMHAVGRDAKGGYVIDMGVPRFAPQAISMHGWDQVQGEYAIDIDGESIRFGAVSMGNPHAVIEVTDVAAAPVAALGQALQRDPSFAESVNVGFAEIVAPDRIRLRVYERGVGETLACGSGACAAVAVLVRRGRIDANREVHVDLPGGSLRIRYDQAAQTRVEDRILMGGPTAFVFEGEWQ